jgi:hypothetical protein
VERPHDRGIDFVAHPPDGSAPIGLQVKHSTDPNAPTTLAELRRFPTDCEKYGLNRGVFITNRTASVTHHAEFSDSNGLELELFDREAFKAYFAKLRGFPLG